MEVRCLGASGQLGYGLPAAALRAGMARRPHAIGADLGSTDPGPHALGAGRDPRGAAVVRRDLELLLGAGLAAGVPVLMGSAGIAGGRPHLHAVADLIRDLAQARGWRFRLALIDAEVERSWVADRLRQGRVRPLGSAQPLIEADIDASVRIVAQMGVEPFVEALDAGADVVLAGRACDTAIFAAHPILSGADQALAYHMAKILECASQCAEPGGRDAILGTLAGDAFQVESMAPQRRCTPTGVAAHALYEEADPFRFAEPSGHVDTSRTTYEAASERTTSVSGSRWVAAAQPTLKLEGAASAGFRTVCVGGVRDPQLLARLPEVTAQVSDRVSDVVGDQIAAATYSLQFHLYGYDAVLGPAESASFAGHEAGVLIDVVAESQETAHAVCASARQHLLHAAYPGSVGAAGNLALPFSPSELDAGPVYRFSVYHLVEVADPGAPFDVVLEEVGG